MGRGAFAKRLAHGRQAVEQPSRADPAVTRCQKSGEGGGGRRLHPGAAGASQRKRVGDRRRKGGTGPPQRGVLQMAAEGALHHLTQLGQGGLTGRGPVSRDDDGRTDRQTLEPRATVGQRDLDRPAVGRQRARA